MSLAGINNSGVSEVVGAVLLLFLVVVGIGGISVILLSQPVPEEAPNTDIIITSAGGEVLLTHNGGDDLQKGTVEIRFDGVPVGVEFVEGEEDWPWSIGETLWVPGEEPPKRVTVISTAGSGSVIKSSLLIDGDKPAGSTVTPGEDPHDPFDDLKEGSVYFYRPSWGVHFNEKKWKDDYWKDDGCNNYSQDEDSAFADIILSGRLKFTAASSDSYLVNKNGNKDFLGDGDIVEIIPVSYYRDHSSFGHGIRIFRVPGKGWQVSAIPKDAFEVRIDYKKSDKDKKSDKGIYDSWITGSDNFESNLSLTSGSWVPVGEPYTRLVISDRLVRDGTDSSEYTISGLRPAFSDMMVLDISADGSVHFMGSASEVKEGNAVIWSE